LDFGSGCGRVIHNYQDAPASCQLYGTDIDSELVGWCKKYLPRFRWSTNGYLPPLSFANNTFDLIYAISVFTHLDEEYQYAWLRELQRIAKPGATLILSVHGEYCISKLASSYQSRIHSYGFLFVSGPTGRVKLDKLPDFYQSAYHTQEYIRREWSAYFDVVHYLERGINNHQDAVLLRKA
jgi:ubiquinone/menaquinone biosynthesis C-methylase UbiE